MSWSRPAKQWWTITATKQRSGEEVRYDMCVEVHVYAENESAAYKKIRPEFRDWFFSAAPMEILF